MQLKALRFSPGNIHSLDQPDGQQSVRHPRFMFDADVFLSFEADGGLILTFASSVTYAGQVPKSE